MSNFFNILSVILLQLGNFFNILSVFFLKLGNFFKILCFFLATWQLIQHSICYFLARFKIQEPATTTGTRMPTMNAWWLTQRTPTTNPKPKYCRKGEEEASSRSHGNLAALEELCCEPIFHTNFIDVTIAGYKNATVFTICKHVHCRKYNRQFQDASSHLVEYSQIAAACPSIFPYRFD